MQAKLDQWNGPRLRCYCDLRYYLLFDIIPN